MTIAQDPITPESQVHCVIYTRSSSVHQTAIAIQSQERACCAVADEIPNWVIAEESVAHEVGAPGLSVEGSPPYDSSRLSRNA